LYQAVELSKEGLKQFEIAEDLGISKATASRYLRQAREKGLLPPKTALNS
jgi:DNA-binding transcriptional regulator LsrR (DeoR family)